VGGAKQGLWPERKDEVIRDKEKKEAQDALLGIMPLRKLSGAKKRKKRKCVYRNRSGLRVEGKKVRKKQNPS